MDRRDHWDEVYRTRDPTAVSWYQEHPDRSLSIIGRLAPDLATPIIDVGGGASRLVDLLIGRGYRHLTVLDIAPRSLEHARGRLGQAAQAVRWITADVTEFEPPERYGVWHDRAVFHFLTDDDDRAAYVTTLDGAVAPDGHVVVATFARDGPERCSGLPVRRHDPDDLAAALGPMWEAVGFDREAHTTPGGHIQHFLYGWFRRPADAGSGRQSSPSA